MAKSKTPAKRARKAEENRIRNAANKSAMKTAIKKFQAALAGNESQAVSEWFNKAVSLIDRNVSKGILHKNTAARKKSKLAKKLQSLAK